MTTASTHLRYERKFIPDGLGLAEMLALVRVHPAMFREAYPERPVNNLYFDTPDLRHYHEHIHGAAQRVKVRLRWYGAWGGRLEQPVLEFKTRHGTVSRKETHALPALTLDGNFPRAILEAAAAGGGLPEAARFHLRGLEPSLANRYHRRYFHSADRAVRLTVDWGLQFFAPRHLNGARRPLPHDGPAVILELKYGEAHAEDAARITNAFPFRLTRCSKYVLGVECLSRA